MYESFWAYIVRQRLTGWNEVEINGTMSWPGQEKYTGTGMYQLNAEVNIRDKTTGEAVPLKSRKAQGSGFTPVSFKEYRG